MNPIKTTLGAIAAFALAITLTLIGQSYGAEASAAIGLRDLRCESQSNPLGIDAQPPCLSWKLDDPRRSARQTAYRILAASGPDKLAQEEGNVWDSGKVVTDQSHLVEYRGKPLESGQIVHWKVKVWDKDGKESPWSEPARWEMGLLKREDWKAKSISGTIKDVINDTDWINFVLLPDIPADKVEAERKNWLSKMQSSNVFGKDFTVDELPDSVRLYATAKGWFAIYLNGQRVGDEERLPVEPGMQNNVSYYSVYDITSMLRKGENRLRCINWRSELGLSANFTMQINGVTKSERSVLVATDETWRQRPSQSFSARPNWGRAEVDYYNFNNIPDYTLGLEGTTGPEWTPVKASTENQIFTRNFVQPERVVRRVTPVEVFSPAPGVYTFDLGELITGNIEWRLPKDLPVGTRVVFRYGSELKVRTVEGSLGGSDLFYPPDMRITDRSRLLAKYTSQCIGHQIPTTVVVVGLSQPATWRTFLNNIPFRYVEVIGLKSPPRSEDLTGLIVYTDCPRIGTFESSEPTFNAFHDLCVKTALMCQHGIIVDCWDRERKAWNGNWTKSLFFRYPYNIDATLRQQTLENGRMVRKIGRCSMTTMEEAQRVLWSGSLVYLPQVSHVFGGDTRMIAENVEFMLKHLRHYRASMNANGFLDETSGIEIYGDCLSYRFHHGLKWLQQQPAPIQKSWFEKGLYGGRALISPVPMRERWLLINAVQCDMAGICAAWAAVLGRKEEQAELQTLHDNWKAAIHKAYFNPEDGSYGRFPEIMPLGEDSLDAYALFANIPPVHMRRSLVQSMVRELRERGHFITTGFFSSLAYFRTLADFGYAEDAYKVMTREDWPSHKNMLRLSDGAALYESFHCKTRKDGEGSFVHADFAQLADWFWYGLGGLRGDAVPAHAGLKHFTLAPQIPTKMAWAKISHESPYGKIVSSWKNAGGKAVWEVTVPPNSTATALIPAARVEDIREAGKPLIEAGLKAEQGPNNTTTCELPAGSYRFDFQLSTNSPDAGDTKK